MTFGFLRKNNICQTVHYLQSPYEMVWLFASLLLTAWLLLGMRGTLGISEGKLQNNVKLLRALR
jgi:hypothetical protein